MVPHRKRSSCPPEKELNKKASYWRISPSQYFSIVFCTRGIFARNCSVIEAYWGDVRKRCRSGISGCSCLSRCLDFYGAFEIGIILTLCITWLYTEIDFTVDISVLIPMAVAPLLSTRIKLNEEARSKADDSGEIMRLLSESSRLKAMPKKERSEKKSSKRRR